MRYRFFRLLVAGSLAGSLLGVTAGVVLAAACTTTCYVDVATGSDANDGDTPGTAKKTIGAAIAQVSVGGTVIVAGGIYPEYVVIDKSITVNGANSGIACRSPRPNQESVITGTAAGAVQILANNVTFAGFQVSSGANALQAGIHTNNAINGYLIKNNLISQSQIGLYANSNGVSTVSCNIFDGNNEPGSAGGTGLYSDAGSSGLVIDSNLFRNHLVNHPVNFAAVAPYVNTHTALSITNNTFEGTNGFGVRLLGVNGLTFTGNDVDSNDATLVVVDTGNSNFTITGNTFHDAFHAVRVRDDAGGAATTNVVVNRNSILNHSDYGVGVESGYTGTLDATCNWWGSALGPTDPGADGTLGPVDADPFLTTADLAGPCGVVAQGPDLTINKFNVVPFAQLLPGRWFVSVRNEGDAATVGEVTVVDTLPARVFLLSIQGTGWDCTRSTRTCTRSDPLAPGGTYPPIVVKVFVSVFAPSPVVNVATVSGGGDTNTTNNSDEDAAFVFRWLDWIQ